MIPPTSKLRFTVFLSSQFEIFIPGTLHRSMAASSGTIESSHSDGPASPNTGGREAPAAM